MFKLFVRNTITHYRILRHISFWYSNAITTDLFIKILQRRSLFISNNRCRKQVRNICSLMKHVHCASIFFIVVALDVPGFIKKNVLPVYPTLMKNAAFWIICVVKTVNPTQKLNFSNIDCLFFFLNVLPIFFRNNTVYFFLS